MNDIITLKAIVVDDEPGAVNNLCKLISTYCSSIIVSGTSNSVDNAAEMINNTQPDVVFLDVSMPGKNGFELLGMLKFHPLIVFVTAYEQYAIKAIKASAVDFLLKPVDVNDLKQVEQKLLHVQQFKTSTGMAGYSSALTNLATIVANPGVVRTITIPTTDGYTIADIKDILYMEGVNNYTAFHFSNSTRVLVSRTLREYEELLSDAGFIRIHKSSIINLMHLKKLLTEDGVSALMADGKMLAVSRRRASELMERTKQYRL